jgi:hypothetical protein
MQQNIVANPDIALLEELRGDAFRIRFFVLRALMKNLLFHSGTASKNAHRATALYSEMLARFTMLFQENAARLFPAYLETM